MSYGKLQLCNVSLAMIGADSIFDFDEHNKRSRLCDKFYDITRDYLLTKFDWPFARSYAKLQRLDVEVPDGMFAYALPAECKTPRSIAPRGSRDNWEIMGNQLWTHMSEVGLYYTALEVDVSKASDTFSMLLATALAVKLAPPVAQDPKLTTALQEQYRLMQAEAWESDANIGNDYRAYDEDPNSDTFVNPDVALDQHLSPRVIT